MLVAGSPHAVIPCFIAGSYQALPPQRRFPRPAKLGLRIGKPISFNDTPDDRQGWESVAQAAEAAVSALADANPGE